MQRHEYERMFQFEDWYWWYRGLHELVCAEVKRSIPDRSPAILDAGCGTGRMMELLGSQGHVEGFDSSAAAVDFCRQRGVPDCRPMDLNAWDPDADRWEVIISLDVICCTGVLDDRAILGKFHRALTGNGYLIMNLPAFPLLRRTHDRAVSIARRYRRKDLVRDLEALGFRVVYAGYRLPPLFLVILAKKIIEKRFKTRNIESDLRPLPRPLNAWLLGYQRLENRLILRGMRFPFGSSLFIVAAKTGP